MATTTKDRSATERPAAAARLAAPEAPSIPERAPRPAAAPRRAGPTFDQFALAQLPMALAVALILGMIAFAAIRTMPSGGTGGAAAAQTGATGAAGGTGAAPITAFSSEPVAQQILVAADPTGALKWDRTTYEAQAGDVTFVVANKSASTHNFAVEGGNVKAQSKNFGANTTNSYTLKGLAPGEYLLVCNFPGHRAGGMVSKLIVK